MNHYQNECKHGVVFGQCRCPNPSKVVHLVKCPPRGTNNEHDNLEDRLGDPLKASESPAEPSTANEAALVTPGLRSRLREALSALQRTGEEIKNIIQDLEEL